MYGGRGSAAGEVNLCTTLLLPLHVVPAALPSWRPPTSRIDFPHLPLQQAHRDSCRPWCYGWAPVLQRHHHACDHHPPGLLPCGRLCVLRDQCKARWWTDLDPTVQVSTPWPWMVAVDLPQGLALTSAQVANTPATHVLSPAADSCPPAGTTVAATFTAQAFQGARTYPKPATDLRSALSDPYT